MGTFIKALNVHAKDQSARLAEQARLIEQHEDNLKIVVSKLKLSREQQSDLERQIAEYRKAFSFQTISAVSVVPLPAELQPSSIHIINTVSAAAAAHISSEPQIQISPSSFLVNAGQLVSEKKTCPRCGGLYDTPLTYSSSPDLCEQCRKSLGSP